MPNRILREGILTSARVDELSESAELFYRRLHSKVDDYGRCEAHPELLRTACYPLRVDRVKAKHVIAWLAECEKARLLVVYKAGSKTYLQIVDFRQQVRTESKFPAPDDHLIRKCYADDAHMNANDHLVVVGGVGEGVGVVEIASGAKAPSAGEPVDKSKVNGKAVAYIPLNDGTQFAVTTDFAAELAKLYPKVDVAQTLNEIRGWNIAKPSRRKTRRGVLSHINAWMAREQNRGA